MKMHSRGLSLRICGQVEFNFSIYILAFLQLLIYSNNERILFPTPQTISTLRVLLRALLRSINTPPPPQKINSPSYFVFHLILSSFVSLTDAVMAIVSKFLTSKPKGKW